ncbi:hypothetical protein QFZ20_003008 [Flavobacterium sp. W4I14]|nr:hypothetical protein [Flavobacterium sp. W4I14]
MESRVKITFFMLVTNRDCIIADFSIKSYQKIKHVNRPFGKDEFVLYIYLNNLSEENKNFYLDKWKSYPYTFIYDNAEKIAEMQEKPYPGQITISPEGVPRYIDDYCEVYDELWSTELKKLATPYIASVDADFEILNADFYFDLINCLDSNDDIIGASSCYAATSNSVVYDSYSGREIFFKERNHTWFCIYKKRAFDLTSISHYYFEEPTENGHTLVYDSAAYFQYHLRQMGLKFISAPASFFGSFVHYGASSKNKTLNRHNINKYRIAFISTYKGLITKKNNLLIRAINNITRKLSNYFFKNYLNAKSSERSTYISQ